MAEEAEPVSLDRESGSESEDATASHGSRAEVIADSLFETTQYVDSRDRSDDTINTLMARLAPSIRKHVEEALLPLVSALRSREENEQKHRNKLLCLEMEKLLLERKKLMFKRYRNSPRSNRYKVGVKKKPRCAAQQNQAVVGNTSFHQNCGAMESRRFSNSSGGSNSWLREKNIAGGETQTSVLLREAMFDSNRMAEREGQKHDF